LYHKNTAILKVGNSWISCNYAAQIKGINQIMPMLHMADTSIKRLT